VLEFVSTLSALGITLNILAIYGRKTIWSRSSNSWYGMVALATLMTAGSLGFLLAHSLACYGFANWNSTMVMIWNTAAVAASIVNLAPNSRISFCKSLCCSGLRWSIRLRGCITLRNQIRPGEFCLARLQCFSGKQVNSDFWEQLASRFLEEQRGKEIDTVRRTAEQALSGAKRARIKAEKLPKHAASSWRT